VAKAASKSITAAHDSADFYDLPNWVSAFMIYDDLSGLFKSPQKVIEEMRAAVASGEVRSVSINRADSLYYDRHEAKYKERQIDTKPTLNTAEFWRNHRFIRKGWLAEREDDGTWTVCPLSVLLLRKDAAARWPYLEDTLMWLSRVGRAAPPKRKRRRAADKGGRPKNDWTKEIDWLTDWLTKHMAAGKHVAQT
jgi:hypothetical protein